MTVIAVLVDPPRAGLVLSELVESSPLTAAEAADLYAAMFKDVCAAAHASGGDLLVNYRAESDLPAAHAADADAKAEAEVRAAVADALDGVEDVRFEVQVGSSFAARAGNTATHLLREEEVNSVAVVRPTAAFLARTVVDTAAMKLRSTPVVLGPAPEGRVYYAAFADLLDFENVFDSPAVTTLTDRARAADLDVDFVEMRPVVERGADLATALTTLRSRRAAGRIVPKHTAKFFDAVGLTVAADGDELTVHRV